MLEKLLEHGLQEGYFTIKEIKDIEKSCCDVSTTNVIDFDETKKFIINLINQSPLLRLSDPKSCDALMIIPSNDRLDFIEFKGLNKVVEHLKTRVKEEEVDTAIDWQVNRFGIDEKIKDSLFLLDFILKLASLKLTKAEREYYAKDVEKSYIIMVDRDIEEDPIKNIAFNLEFLSEASNYKEKIISCIEDKITDTYERFEINKPIVMSSERIDSFYRELQEA